MMKNRNSDNLLFSCSQLHQNNNLSGGLLPGLFLINLVSRYTSYKISEFRDIKRLQENKSLKNYKE